MTRRLWVTIFGACVVLAAVALTTSLVKPRHNVIIFVADGLRYDAVNPVDAPEMSRVRAEGVDFANSHSLVPTVTTANASAIATGHQLGDTGDYANSVFLGMPALKAAFLSLVAFYEDDATLAEANARFGGDYLNEETLLHRLHRAGYATASIGKQGPVAVQDVTARDGRGSIVIDDETGEDPPAGVTLPKTIVDAIKAAGLEWPVPDRGLNSDSGSSIMPGVRVANVQQQDWFARVATEVLLPRFARAHRPFAMVFWSRDPDGTQHNHGDSLNTLMPGINGPTVKQAVKNADDDLGRLRAALVKLGLDKATDVVVTADHGFSTISKASVTSPAAQADYIDVPKGFLPPGFFALDLGRALDLPVWESSGLPLSTLGHPRSGNAMLAQDAAKPQLLIGANGGAELIWMPGVADRAAMAKRIVAAVTPHDYTPAIFVHDRLGKVDGALPLSTLQLVGSARTPAPDMVVSLRSDVIPGCTGGALLCASEVTDGSLQQGQGSHGGFSRANTRNMMAAVGPDFRRRFVDSAPVSNADWAPTLARVLGVPLPSKGKLTGRSMAEALKGGRAPAAKGETLRSTPGPNGFVSALNVQRYAGKTYIDAASRSVGFRP